MALHVQRTDMTRKRKVPITVDNHTISKKRKSKKKFLMNKNFHLQEDDCISDSNRKKCGSSHAQETDMARTFEVTQAEDNDIISKKGNPKNKSLVNKKFHLQKDNCISEPNKKKQCTDAKQSEKMRDAPWNKGSALFDDKSIKTECTKDSSLQQSIIYYEKIFQSLKTELNSDSKEMFAENALKESEGKEVELSCHGTGSYCLELLLSECRDPSTMQRFMAAFARDKIPVYTSANASHITETLICYAAKSLQNWWTVLNDEDSEEKRAVLFNLNWLTDFGEFAVENLNSCLNNSYASHVVCVLVKALAGDISGMTEFMSKNLKVKKHEFRSQYIEQNASAVPNVQETVIVEEIPKFFAKVLKNLYKSLVSSEVILDSLMDSNSSIVIEALISALKRRFPKRCKRMIGILVETLCSKRNEDNIPIALLHKSCSFVFDKMFQAADDELQLTLWKQYIVDCLGRIVVHPVGNFVIQRIFDAVQNKSVFQTICEAVWLVFDDVLMSHNFGVFVSLSSACNRLSAQQADFMKNIMLCLHCYEPEVRQSQLLPLLLGFQQYEKFVAIRESGVKGLTICLQGSLVAQAVLKFHKPLKIVHSMVNMALADLEILAGHVQGCHVLNAFFGSISVGEKNKEKLLHHLKPSMVSITCNREKSLTLSRIWVLLPLKLKEIIARELVQHKEALTACSSGYAIWKKFGIHYYKRPLVWRDIQKNPNLN